MPAGFRISAQANYFGPDYVDRLGGPGILERAGFAKLEAVAGGMYVRMPELRNPHEFELCRDRLEAVLGASNGVFDDGPGISGDGAPRPLASRRFGGLRRSAQRSQRGDATRWNRRLTRMLHEPGSDRPGTRIILQAGRSPSKTRLPRIRAGFDACPRSSTVRNDSLSAAV